MMMFGPLRSFLGDGIVVVIGEHALFSGLSTDMRTAAFS